MITDSGTAGNVVEGNYIGTDATGTRPLANGHRRRGHRHRARTQHGRRDHGRRPQRHLGQRGPGCRYRSARAPPATWSRATTSAPTSTGTGPCPTAATACESASGATANTVGGTTAGARDVISGNAVNGVVLGVTGTSDNVVEGDYIGTDVTGTRRSANGQDGVDDRSGASANTIGGTTPGARDVISGNAAMGVVITDAGTSGNVVEGDYIGTNAAGTGALGNADRRRGHPVGGDRQHGRRDDGRRPRRHLRQRSQRRRAGRYSGTSDNVVEGDYIGTDAYRHRAPSATARTASTSSAARPANTIGGTTTGARERHLRQRASTACVITDSGTSDNVVEGDYIGTDPTGADHLDNGHQGVDILAGATSNTVGGTTTGARDVISGNANGGVLISGSGTSGNVVEGDYIGTTAAGTAALANGRNGVDILAGATSNTVGGTTAGAGDVISGNTALGVEISGSGTAYNVVEGDYIGTNAAGTGALPNGINGVDILSGATSNTVGGTTAGARDVISGNTFNGVVLAYAGTMYNVVEGDYIGTDRTGAKALANGQDGVDLIGGATSNMVGGTTTGAWTSSPATPGTAC